MAHDHGLRLAQNKALKVALAANLAFLVVEAAGGLVFHSLALLGDAAHMVTDVGGLTIALIAHRLLERPASARHTFGLQRAEVLAAQASGITLLIAGLWLLVAAIRRAATPVDVEGAGLVV
ncbi:MAG: cobalt-zinc-cadmium efflux system protein, partial [Actinomycetota bacterium]|nr:cobalt-zinc-cadmium efflux system protein [Actinomycetota bacterium]